MPLFWRLDPEFVLKFDPNSSLFESNSESISSELPHGDNWPAYWSNCNGGHPIWLRGVEPKIWAVPWGDPDDWDDTRFCTWVCTCNGCWVEDPVPGKRELSGAPLGGVWWISGAPFVAPRRFPGAAVEFVWILKVPFSDEREMWKKDRNTPSEGVSI